ncbi:TPA: superantigen-like protein [Staphylococcus aureus]|uniref:exotoxin beta-grasp domain-containing protein n=1 Tax=Staphylococcus aureus TaxID=1280 RepID=UPI001C58EF00|nr:superantigen-like protein [Staphylococcus aureus]MBW1326061.1 superantigen-like protein [Staphylococcus aureus]MBW1371953.1 superantigen-like protein [Staphylococcus aureus]HDE7864251.1 superantigen-like protein [Staphylococcus aureus]HDF3691849.1 superantigen-like protein [Staphylococcus aureus]HDF4911807.1 superantigen-like protein [Staphylococcus aureus]
MKIRIIAKASLALGLVTTGASIVTTQSANAEVASALKAGQLAKISVSPSAITTTTQAVNAEQNRTANTEQASKSNTENVSTSPSTKTEQTPKSNIQKATQQTPSVTTTPSPNVQPQSPTTKQAQKEINPKFKGLRSYYTKPSLEFKNELGIIIKKWTTIRFMNIVPDYFIYKIALVGKDDKKYGEGVHRHVDVFIVLEQNKYGVDKYSVGGITKANRKKVDYNARIKITKEDKKGTISHDVSEYKITKEEISLKELDFKLRKQLIEQHNLYGNIGSGTIVIKMKNGGKYTFELHKKLQQHRMADVIDGTNIDRIEVNLKSS